MKQQCLEMVATNANLKMEIDKIGCDLIDISSR